MSHRRYRDPTRRRGHLTKAESAELSRARAFARMRDQQPRELAAAAGLPTDLIYEAIVDQVYAGAPMSILQYVYNPPSAEEYERWMKEDALAVHRLLSRRW